MIKRNKTIDYRLKATDTAGKLKIIDDSADMTLPSIEKQTDTLKGAGIMGEIDMPGYGIAPMSLSIGNKCDNPDYAMLSRPGEIKIEVSWVNDYYDTSKNRVSTQANKVFMTVFNKKYEPGKIEVGASMDGSMEFEVISYRKLVDGKEVLLVDKLNYKYVVNGIDYMEKIRAALQ